MTPSSAHCSCNARYKYSFVCCSRNIFAILSLFNFVWVLRDSFSESIVPTNTFSNPPNSLDVLFVPGGAGTRLPQPQLDSVINFINTTYPSLQYLVTVCTGASLAARAGVLDGRNATTNKKAFQWVASLGPNVNWVPRARWVVDGNVYTTSGVSAGIDGTFGFLSDVYGEAVAQNISNGMEYVRWLNASYDPFADLYGL